MLEAVGRRLSPLEKTAMVAGSNSTHDSEGLTEDDILEELVSKQAGKTIELPKKGKRSPNLVDKREDTAKQWKNFQRMAKASTKILKNAGVSPDAINRRLGQRRG